MLHSLWTLCAVVGSLPPPLLPPGFSHTVLSTQLDAATCLVATPDGRLFVGELDGDVWIYANGALQPQALIHVPTSVVISESAGLLGLELDPNFAQNGWLYAYYTTVAARNRVARFTVVGSSASLASEFVVWENVSPQVGDHNGGGLAFGPDGFLYISTGDQFISAYAQDLTREDGKLLRVAPDGSIPIDNPFVDHPTALPTIYASGLRNPFRLTGDTVHSTVWIGDVGGNSSFASEEIDRAAAGANYGWPFAEGESCYVSSCGAFTEAAHAYRHDDSTYVTGQPQASVTVGEVYDSTVFPLAYRGNLFYGDYANNWIRRLELDAQGAVIGDFAFAGAPSVGAIVDMSVGPDGALYYVTFGSGGSGMLCRIAYQVGGNAPPVVVAEATPTQGLAPLHVVFDGSSSFDPDQGPQALQLTWDFGDGQQSTLATTEHVYTQDGNYSVSLFASDGAASSQSTPFDVRVGNPPLPSIDLPLAGTTYRAGDTIQLAGSATDAEDGVLPASALTWRVELVHASHVHPAVGPIYGVAQTSFDVPSVGHPPESTHFVVHLSAVDSSGLSQTVSRPLVPEVAIVAVDTWPTGIPVFLDGQPELTPRLYESLAGYQLAVEAQRSIWLNGELWLFVRWTDNGAAAHTFATPPEGELLRAIYALGRIKNDVSSIVRPERNAEFDAAIGRVAFASPNDPNSLRVGRTAAGQVELALGFQPSIPRGATILSAYVRFTAALPQQGHLVSPIRAYDVGNAPPFVDGSATALSQVAPLTTALVIWDASVAPVGQPLTTADVSSLVQAVVDRPDWDLGHTLGLVFQGSASGGSPMRGVANLASGTPAELVVQYALPPPIPQHPPIKH